MSIRVAGSVALFGAYLFRLPRCAKKEERLATQCADFLRLAAPADLFFTHVPNEGKRGALAQFILECMGRQKGMLDLHMLFRSVAYYVEFKIKPNRLTTEQIDVSRRLVEAGGRCAVVYSFSEFVAQMKAWGIVEG